MVYLCHTSIFPSLYVTLCCAIYGDAPSAARRSVLPRRQHAQQGERSTGTSGSMRGYAYTRTYTYIRYIRYMHDRLYSELCNLTPHSDRGEHPQSDPPVP